MRFEVSPAVNFGVTILLHWYRRPPGSDLWDASYRRGAVTPAIYNAFG